MSAPTMTKTDEQIQREVLDELKWDARVRPNEIGVAVKDGIVTFTGRVVTTCQEVGSRGCGAHRVRG